MFYRHIGFTTYYIERFFNKIFFKPTSEIKIRRFLILDWRIFYIQGVQTKLSRNYFVTKKQYKMHIFKLFIEKSKTGDRCTCWAAIYSIKSPLASITALIRPLNRTKALTTMSLSMMVNKSMMEATRMALML